MRRLPFRIVSLTLGLMLSVVVHSRAAFADERPAVKVGSLLSLSGGLEQWCGYIRQGIELAREQPGPIRVDVIFEDDQSSDTKQTLTAARKLIEHDGVDIITSWTTSTVALLVPLATEAQTPLMIGAYDHRVATGGKFVFGAFVNYDLMPREIAHFFVRNLSATKIGLVIAEDDWSQGYEAPFREEIQRLGATIVLSERIAPDETDPSSLILRLKRSGAEAVLAPLYGTSLYTFLQKARQARFSTPIHVGDGMFEEDIRIAGPSAEGVYASQIWVESEELRAKYKARFGNDANALQIGLVTTGYDWVMHIRSLVAEILQSGKQISRETLREGLRTHRSVGYLGEQMYGGPPAESGEITAVVSDGKYVPVVGAPRLKATDIR